MSWRRSLGVPLTCSQNGALSPARTISGARPFWSRHKLSMRTEAAYLLDMLDAARNILEFTTGLTFDDFSASKLVQSAVIREILVLGEAARHVSAATQAAIPAIDWALIIGMRNRLIH